MPENDNTQYDQENGYYRCGCGELVPDGEFCFDCYLARDIIEGESDVEN